MSNKPKATIERSAGGVVVRETDGGSQVLLINDPYGKWGLPKGHLEGNETSGEAALREVREETGLSDTALGPQIGTIDWYFRAQGRLIHKFCDFFLMRSQAGDPVPEVSEGITECRWLPMDEAVRLVTYQNAREMIQAADEVLTSQGRELWTSNGEAT